MGTLDIFNTAMMEVQKETMGVKR